MYLIVSLLHRHQEEHFEQYTEAFAAAGFDHHLDVLLSITDAELDVCHSNKRLQLLVCGSSVYSTWI